MHKQLYLNLFILFPLITVAPGYVLTRTFISRLNHFSFTEVWFFRVVLGLVLNSFVAVLLSIGKSLTAMNFCFWIVLMTLSFYAVSRFKLFPKNPMRALQLEDFYALFLLFIVAALTLWPSEQIYSPFLNAMDIMREKGWLYGRGWVVEGSLASLWYVIFIDLFEIRIALLASPFFAVLSVLGVYFCAKRLTGFIGAICASLVHAGLFVQIWFSRTTETFMIEQFFYVAALYIGILWIKEKQSSFGVFLLIDFLLFALLGHTHRNWTIPLFFTLLVILKTTLLKDKRKLFHMLMQYAFVAVFIWGLYSYLNQAQEWNEMIPKGIWFLVAASSILCVFLVRKEVDEWMIFLWFLFNTSIVLSFGVGTSPYMQRASVSVPILIPSLSLLSCLILSWISQGKRVYQAFCIMVVVIFMLFEIVSHWNLLWVKDHSGVLGFYHRLVKTFNPNDVVLSSNAHLSDQITKLYGVKCYRVDGPEYFDPSFQKELQSWIDGGGRVLLISEEKVSQLGESKLNLINIQNFHTQTILHSDKIPKRMEKLVMQLYIYEINKIQSPMDIKKS